MSRAQFLWGLSTGVAVLGIAGAFWWGAGLGPFASTLGHGALPAVVVVQLAGLAASVLAAWRLRRRSGFRRAALDRHDPETRRMFTGFSVVVAIELVMVGVAVALTLRSGRDDLLWAAIGLAVSLHFAPLGRVFHVPAYYGTAALGSAVCLVALIAPLGPWRMVWLGTLMAAVMWGSAVYLLVTADALAARVSAVS